jgi:hypothetical protein
MEREKKRRVRMSRGGGRGGGAETSERMEGIG